MAITSWPTCRRRLSASASGGGAPPGMRTTARSVRSSVPTSSAPLTAAPGSRMRTFRLRVRRARW